MSLNKGTSDLNTLVNELEEAKAEVTTEKKQKKVGTLIKSFHGKRKTDSGSTYDCIILWYRDENGKKKAIYYDRPKVPYYLVKDKDSREAKFSPLYISEDKLEKHEVYSDLLYHELAEKTGCLAFYDRMLAAKGSRCYEMNNLFRHPRVYDADMDISDRKIAEFYQEYEPNKDYVLHKAYFDIEVDLAPNGITPDKNGNYGYIGFPDEKDAPCPVSIITLIDGKEMKIYSFVVRNKLNKSLKEFEDDIENRRLEVLEKIRTEDETPIVDSEVIFFNNELAAIEAFFNKVHELDPDYIAAWNQCFDVITLINRLLKLYRKRETDSENALNPYTAMLNTVCDVKYSHYSSGESNIFIPAKAHYTANELIPIGKRIDFFDVLDGINWVDSEYYYALNHSAGGKKDSYKLDSIAYEELRKEKLPFYEGQTIKNLAWLNYTQYYEYNVRDVLLLLLLENKTLDFNTLQALSNITNTRKEKVFTKSVSLSNFINSYARMENYHINCNKNKKYYSRPTSGYEVDDVFAKLCLHDIPIIETDEEYLKAFSKRDRMGALVSDPMMNEHVGVEIIPGKYSMHLFKNVCDQDLSSLYPSIYRAFNLDSSTYLGKFYLIDEDLKQRLKDKYDYNGLFKLSEKDDENSDIDNDDDEDEDSESSKSVSMGETNDLGPTVVDSIISQNWERIGEKYFKLPSIEETYEKLEEYIQKRDNK